MSHTYVMCHGSLHTILPDIYIKPLDGGTTQDFNNKHVAIKLWSTRGFRPLYVRFEF